MSDHLPSYICGRCGKDTRTEVGRNKIYKVMQSGYGNLLCWSCRCEFEDALKDIARAYLNSKETTVNGD